MKWLLFIISKKIKEDSFMKNMKNQNDKELIYTESKTLRNETLDNVSYDFLITLLKISGKSMRRAAIVRARAYRL